MKSHRELLSNIEEWQVRVDALARDHGDELSEKMRIAALVHMLRGGGDIKNDVCQSLDAQSSYRGIRDKLRNLMANRVSLEDSGLNKDDSRGGSARVPIHYSPGQSPQVSVGGQVRS